MGQFRRIEEGRISGSSWPLKTAKMRQNPGPVREPSEQVVKDIRRAQHYPNIISKTFKYEDIEQIPAEAESTSNASKFHNKEGEIHEENVARTRIGRSDYYMRFICPAEKCDFRTAHCCQPRQYHDRGQ
jgi:hypothetical protein